MAIFPVLQKLTHMCILCSPLLSHAAASSRPLSWSLCCVVLFIRDEHSSPHPLPPPQTPSPYTLTPCYLSDMKHWLILAYQMQIRRYHKHGGDNYSFAIWLRRLKPFRQMLQPCRRQTNYARFSWASALLSSCALSPACLLSPIAKQLVSLQQESRLTFLPNLDRFTLELKKSLFLGNHHTVLKAMLRMQYERDKPAATEGERMSHFLKVKPASDTSTWKIENCRKRVSNSIQTFCQTELVLEKNVVVEHTPLPAVRWTLDAQKSSRWTSQLASWPTSPTERWSSSQNFVVKLGSNLPNPWQNP